MVPQFTTAAEHIAALPGRGDDQIVFFKLGAFAMVNGVTFELYLWPT